MKHISKYSINGKINTLFSHRFVSKDSFPIEKNPLVDFYEMNQNFEFNFKPSKDNLRISLKYLGDALSKNYISIINIHNFMSTFFIEDLSDFASGIKRNQTLKSLRISPYFSYTSPNNSRNMKLLSESISMNPTIECLDISTNKIGNDFKSFANVFKNEFQLTELYLNNIMMDDESMKYLAISLEKNFVLIKLSLYNNQLTKISGQYIGGLLSKNNCLKYLNVSSNILASGTSEIFESLHSNDSLEVLMINNISMDNIEGIGLGKMILKNKKLNRIDMHFNVKLNENTTNFIGDCIEKNNIIKRFKINITNIDRFIGRLWFNYSITDVDFRVKEIPELMNQFLNKNFEYLKFQMLIHRKIINLPMFDIKFLFQ